MKTERRHELQTNVLASSLSKGIEAVKPYSRAVLAVAIALVVGLFAWMYLSTQGTRRSEEGWTDYFQALDERNLELMQGVAQEFSGSIVGHWARLTSADWLLDDGTNRLMTDRIKARDHLQESREEYAGLLLDASEDTIQQRATYGLARADEALGELEKARAEYRTLAEKWPEGPFHAAALARASDLDQMGTKQFYDWLARYEPPPPMANQPGTPGAKPDFLKEPDAGNLKFPSAIEGGTPLPTLEIDPTPGEQPAGETPAETPATEAPAATEAPSTEAPAPEAPAGEKPAEPTPGESGPELK